MHSNGNMAPIGLAPHTDLLGEFHYLGNPHLHAH